MNDETRRAVAYSVQLQLFDIEAQRLSRSRDEFIARYPAAWRAKADAYIASLLASNEPPDLLDLLTSRESGEGADE